MANLMMMRNKLVAISLALIISALVNDNARSFVEGGFIVETESIKVLSPMSLRSKHDGSIANFGVPDYGGYIIGSVVYPDKGSFACEAFPGDKPLKAKSHRPTIVLLDRGDCYFALKVWNAQEAGAAAVLVSDNKEEALLTMDSPEERAEGEGFVERITIPSALVKKSFGDSMKQAIAAGEEVVVKLDWREAVPHPDARVEFQLWTNGNDECGPRCDHQTRFVSDFRGHAQLLEKRGYALFTPHYITWFCPLPFLNSAQCRSQCINRGRYCAPDPEKDFGRGYDGREVVFENLRQLCVHRVGNHTGRPWVWWDFVTDFHLRCSMKNKTYTKACAEDIIKSLDLPLDKVKSCMGDPEADVENPVLKNEQLLQVGKGSRGDVTILPTLVINDVQYRGKLERASVLKAICSGFEEKSEPPICLNEAIETNECLERNGGCWQDKHANITACKDTFRGRVCECPVVNGVQYRGDGYSSCQAYGPARCAMDNGGCWSETNKGLTFSACSDADLSGCRCPTGFRGDGHNCEDIDECKERSACQCENCSCKNKWGGYDCKCKGDMLYISDQDTCIERRGSKFAWIVTFMVLGGMVSVGLGGYIFYKYRLRSYMDSEIMAIMSQYMPLDNQRNQVQTMETEPLRQGSV